MRCRSYYRNISAYYLSENGVVFSEERREAALANERKNECIATNG